MILLDLPVGGFFRRKDSNNTWIKIGPFQNKLYYCHDVTGPRGLLYKCPIVDRDWISQEEEIEEVQVTFSERIIPIVPVPDPAIQYVDPSTVVTSSSPQFLGEK